jgi:signal transduction histidine kinase
VISLLYFLVAVVALALAVQAFVADRDDPARQAFLALATLVAIAYSAFALSLLPALGAMRHLYLLAGCAVPAAALATIDRAFFREPVGATPRMGFVYGGTAIVAPLATLADALLYDPLAKVSLPGLVGGGFALSAFVIALQRLWDAQHRTPLRVDRNRLRYLFGIVLAAVGFTLVEQVGRVVGPIVDPGTLSMSARAVALQGPLPPFSAVFTGISIYFLYHSVVMSRLLDLTEVLSRMTTLLLSAGALVLIDGLTFLWVDTFTVFPFHGTFQIFLASLLFLAAYDPLRDQIAWLVNRSLNRRGHQLLDTLDQLKRRLPSIITATDLTEALLDALHRSGRSPRCSVYLWDARLDAFTCQGARLGDGDEAPLQVVAAEPFVDRLARGAPWYTRSTVERRSQHDPQQAEVLGLMDAMHADVTLPFVSGTTVLGWFHVRDEAWSDGYSAEEILALQDIASRASTVLTNVRSFQAMEEQKRLAALGAMSAGLAHEIRNPLAGLKGAAQVLQSDELDGESQEMLQVIVDEAERLDNVVRQFLDYARPFELHRADEVLNALVAHATTLVRAEGLPEGVTLVEELSGAVPAMPLDRTRITQVVLNLLKNAVQAMPDGGQLTVATLLRTDRPGGPVAELVVRDTGVGMSDAVRDQLFVPFFTTKPAGTGLGLAICERIVRAHGGELDVSTVEGQGSTFVLRLPVGQA